MLAMSLLMASSLAFAQDRNNGGLPLDEPRIPRLEKPWTEAQRPILAPSVGISDEDLSRILHGPEAPGWSEWEATLLRAADELHHDALITDLTRNALAERYDQRQLMEAVFTVGQYNLATMYLNSLGVQFEENFEGFPFP